MPRNCPYRRLCGMPIVGAAILACVSAVRAQNTAAPAQAPVAAPAASAPQAPAAQQAPATTTTPGQITPSTLNPASPLLAPGTPAVPQTTTAPGTTTGSLPAGTATTTVPAGTAQGTAANVGGAPPNYWVDHWNWYNNAYMPYVQQRGYYTQQRYGNVGAGNYGPYATPNTFGNTATGTGTFGNVNRGALANQGTSRLYGVPSAAGGTAMFPQTGGMFPQSSGFAPAPRTTMSYGWW